MSKPRICKSCHWLQNRAEPCWSCSRWGKGKTDHYISAEETLGEYLERKEREEMGLVQAKKVIAGFEHCIKEEECSKCPLADVHAKGWGSCSQLAIDTLKSLIEECELLRAAAREAENPSAEILRFAQDDKTKDQDDRCGCAHENPKYEERCKAPHDSRVQPIPRSTYWIQIPFR